MTVMPSAKARPVSRPVNAGPVTLFLLSAVLMVTAIDYPAVLDFYNHYARMWLIAGGIEQPPYDRIYALDWSNTATNVGIDWIALAVGPVIGAAPLVTITLLLAVVLPPVGAVLLHREALRGASVWQAGFFYFAWSATLIGGFINFQIGLGLAMIGAVLDHRLAAGPPWARLLIRIGFSGLLVFVHIFAVPLFVLAVCALLFGPRFDAVFQSRQHILRMLRTLALAFASMAVAPLLLLLAAKSPPGSVGSGLYWGDSVSKLLSPFWTYNLVVDLVLFLPVLAVLAVALALRDVRFHAGLVVAFGILCVLSLIAPLDALGTGFVGWRFPIMAALVGMAMVLPFPTTSGRPAALLLAVLVVATTMRTAWIGIQWSRNHADVEAVIGALEAAPAWSRILPVTREVEYARRGTVPEHRYFAGTGGDTFRHLPALAVPMFNDIVPNLFAVRGKQPLRVLPAWSAVVMEEMSLISPHALECAAIRGRANSAYLDGWADKFDYVLELNADTTDAYIQDRVPNGLVLREDRGFARLYGIDATALDAADRSGTRCALPPG